MTIQDKPLWVLGYGSLIFKPPPHAKYVIPGIIHGYSRRFWQSSSDHRGTPERKGRTATLISYDDIVSANEFLESVKQYDLGHRFELEKFQKRDLKVYACAFYIPAEYAEEVTEYLDVREQDGYTTHNIPFVLHHDPKIHVQKELIDAIEDLPKDEHTGNHILNSVVYIGTIENESFVGPEAIEDTAKIISEARGPSGENWEYLELLYKSLLKLDKHGKDLYLEALVNEVVRIRQQRALDGSED